MRTLIFLVILAAGSWMLYGWLKRAEAARDKANAAVRRETQSAQPGEAPAQSDRP